MISNDTASDIFSQGASPVSDLVSALFNRFPKPIVEAAEAFLRDRTATGLLAFEESAQDILAQVGGHLVALGIHDCATPALASLTARLSARCSSFEEASEALGEHGVDMDAKTVRRLTLHVGEAALRQRAARVEAAQQGRSFIDELAGRRIAIRVDGGRTRLREGGLRGRRGKSGHRRYKTPWREPKLFTVYVFDARGRKVRAFPPLIDGTFGDADATFRLLVSELLLRGATRAELITLGGDGALWIWNRVDALARALGIPPEKIVRVADFYHAVEHLTTVAELVKGFSEHARRVRVKRMRRHASRRNSLSMWWARVVNTRSGACLASSAIRCSFVETGSELGLSGIFPSNGSVSRRLSFLGGVPRVGSPASPVV